MVEIAAGGSAATNSPLIPNRDFGGVYCSHCSGTPQTNMASINGVLKSMRFLMPMSSQNGSQSRSTIGKKYYNVTCGRVLGEVLKGEVLKKG